MIAVRVKNLSVRDIVRGDVISDPKNNPCLRMEKVVAQVRVMQSPIQLKAGYEGTLHIRTGHARCKIGKIQQRLNKQGGLLEEKPQSLKEGDFALVELDCFSRQICVETYETFPAYGRIVFTESNLCEDRTAPWSKQRQVIIVGAVKSVERKTFQKRRVRR